MMKFWKSAAKGRTGCPVRPPESSLSSSTNQRTLLSEVEETREDYRSIFEKKSKLSLTLNDVLVQKKALKYFIEFMELTGKLFLVKCWLEMDNFRTDILNNDATNEHEKHSKISRAKSFDIHCKCKSQNSSRFNWKGSSILSASGDTNFMLKERSSTSSCENLAEHHAPIFCEMCENKTNMNPTEEAINLFKKYVALEAPNQLDLPDSLRQSIISNICNPEGHIKENCFKPVQDVILKKIENDHFFSFMLSPFYIKAQIDILTQGSLNLGDILFNESILFYFTEYLEQESCSVLLEFLMAVMHFRDNLLGNNSTFDPDQAQADAIILYDKYFSLQATSPIGFPTVTRLQIESDICRDGGPLPTCFDVPYQIVFKTLNSYVKTFLESDIYYKYLSEMIHSVEVDSNHKTHSDCSSEFSISTQNTLLAMGDPVSRKKKRNHSVPDMTIDSNQLYNSDALWQRKRNDGLNLGRVNSLGRFESKFEPDPDKQDRSILKKMVSRFVPSNSSKVEEEMAWQIAHMIVKDVTDLTMAPPENDTYSE